MGEYERGRREGILDAAEDIKRQHDIACKYEPAAARVLAHAYAWIKMLIDYPLDPPRADSMRPIELTTSKEPQE